MRTAIMSNFPSPQPENLRLQLVRRLALVALIVLVASAVLALLVQQVRRPVFILQIFWTDLLLGLVSGFSSRFIFRRQTGLLRFTAGCAVYLTGIFLLGVFTGWQFGIGPLLPGQKGVEWADLGQLLVGVGIVTLTMQAWQRPVLEIAPASPGPRLQPVPRPKRARPVPRPRKGAGRRVRRGPEPKVQTASAIPTEAPAKPKHRRAALRRKPALQLSTVEEHRCPYCLELIEPNDPRGTVECKICHTLHHADCWAITGTCQVPHLNT